MALPDELLDELLSAHLDGATSGDERARVEQLLNDDPAIAEHFRQLRRQAELLRETAFVTPDLPDGFADQIVQAAIDEAQAKQLRVDHPLQLAASGSYVSRKSESRHPNHLSNPRLIATVAGLAASVLFIGYMVKEFGFSSNNQQANHSLVTIPQPEPNQAQPRVNGDPIGPLVTPDLVNTPDTMIVESDAVDPVTVEANDFRPDRTPAMKPETSNLLLADASDTSPPRRMTESPVSPPRTDLPRTEVRVAARPLRMLMVIEVNQTESGRQVGAFNQALASVNILPGSERQVDDALARAVTHSGTSQSNDTDDLNDQESEVVLLESPVKQLDKLVNSLVANRDGIKTVGFSLVSVDDDAPLMRSIESVRTLDPTKIRHQGKSFPIVSNSEEVFDAWLNEVGNRNFAPMENGQAGALIGLTTGAVLKTGSEDGPDPFANILFLVR